MAPKKSAGTPAVQPGRPASPPPVQPDDGKTAILNLWLLLTTNPNFLLKPAAASVAADLAAGNRLGTTDVVLDPDATDSINNWDALVALLQTNNLNEANFTEAALNGFLTRGLQTSFLLNPDGSPGLSYATVLQNASDVFQSIAPDFITRWPNPSPKTMAETLGLP